MTRVGQSGQWGVWVVGGELVSGVRVDETLVLQSVDGAALGADVPEGVPRRDQLGQVLIQLGLEPTERPSPLKRAGQASSSRPAARPSAKSVMS